MKVRKFNKAQLELKKDSIDSFLSHLEIVGRFPMYMPSVVVAKLLYATPSVFTALKANGYLPQGVTKNQLPFKLLSPVEQAFCERAHFGSKFWLTEDILMIKMCVEKFNFYIKWEDLKDARRI